MTEYLDGAWGRGRHAPGREGGVRGVLRERGISQWTFTDDDGKGSLHRGRPTGREVCVLFLHEEKQARRQREGVPGREKSKELSTGQTHAVAGSEGNIGRRPFC